MSSAKTRRAPFLLTIDLVQIGPSRSFWQASATYNAQLCFDLIKHILFAIGLGFVTDSIIYFFFICTLSVDATHFFITRD